MLTSYIIIITFFDAFITDILIIIIVVVIIRFETTNSFMILCFELALSLCEIFLVLTHLLMFIRKLFKHLVLISIFFEHLLLIHFNLLVFELINHLLLIFSSLLLFQIVLIKLVLKIIYVYELFHINRIKTF